MDFKVNVVRFIFTYKYIFKSEIRLSFFLSQRIIFLETRAWTNQLLRVRSMPAPGPCAPTHSPMTTHTQRAQFTSKLIEMGKPLKIALPVSDCITCFQNHYKPCYKITTKALCAVLYEICNSHSHKIEVLEAQHWGEVLLQLVQRTSQCRLNAGKAALSSGTATERCSRAQWRRWSLASQNTPLFWTGAQQACDHGVLFSAELGPWRHDATLQT